LNRVAIITDIHANLPALHASLEAVDAIGVDAVYCSGDLVGYGPHPSEVCAVIEQREIPTIYGDYDYAIVRDLTDWGCAYVTQHDLELGRRSVAWTLAHTDQPHSDLMRALAFDLRFELGEQRVGLEHGLPLKVSEYLFQDKPAHTLERIAAGADCDVLVLGHPHKPWIHTYSGVMFVNGGSVGKPKDGDPRAAFGVLEREDAVQASIKRVPHDAHAVAREGATAGLPGEYAQTLVAAAERKARKR
jgi:putative phosphoesterase